MRTARLCAWLSIAVSALVVAGCGTPVRLNAVPQEIETRAEIPGLPGVRYWADGDHADFTRDAIAAFRREATALGVADAGDLPPAEYLAVSGGGDNGAFGAGLLAGWTKLGTRPQFKVVTGVSTGALIAPFAFLGPDYDDALRESYTRVSKRDILNERGYFSALFDDAMADTEPLKKLVARLVTAELLKAIAVEHEKGRMLLIGTTNLDARRPVIWNVGKIAATGDPKALELLRAILVASAAIPGAFPPVMIEVEAGGKRYQEMHVDGGASAQVFVYPAGISLVALQQRLRRERERKLYVIRNARLDPDWADTERLTLSIAGRAISSLIHTQGIGDLYRIYLVTGRDEVDFNLAYIPLEFSDRPREPFDRDYMNKLFDYGFERAARGYPWAKTPPGYQAPAVEPPLNVQPAARSDARP